MTETPETRPALPLLVLRSLFGGVLMGLANLVPGISGGTMLLATGVYRRFIDAVAEVSTLRFRMRSMVVLGAIVMSAGLAIVLLAGPVKHLVVTQRWVMYSLFIGLTLGGVPLVWRMAQPAGARVLLGVLAGLAVMILMLFLQPSDAAGGGRNYVLLTLAGLAGAAAMVLPGVSGGYLLLVLGQYVPILASISRCRDAVSAKDFAALVQEGHVVIPVGVGVVIGVVVISNLVRWLLHHHEKPTLGLLLGLLLGAVIGLWPFQQARTPLEGEVIKGEVMTAITLAELAEEDYPTEFFTPSVVRVASSLGLIGAGFVTTMLITHVGGGRKERRASDV